MLTRLGTVGLAGVLGAAALSIGATEARADHRRARCDVRYVESSYPATVVYRERGRYYRPVRYYSDRGSYSRYSYGHHRSARRHIGRGLRNVGRALRHVGRRLNVGSRHRRGRGIGRLFGGRHGRRSSRHR